MPDGKEAQAWPGLGDMPSEEFRTALHRVADWVADYREGIEDLKISPDIAPGEIAARLPGAPPDEPVPFKDIFRDFQEIYPARHSALGPSGVPRLFRFDDDCSRHYGRNAGCST